MIKIYELLFEEDTTSATTSTTSSTSSTTQDPQKFKEVITGAVKDAMKKPIEDLTAYVKNAQEEQSTRPTASNALATTSTTATKTSSPSKPAGMTSLSSSGQSSDDSQVANTISKNLTSNKGFLDTLASKIKDSMKINKK